MISFFAGDARVDLDEVEPNTTVLEWLRATGRTGTKEGCASGDCGACTVVTIRPSARGTSDGASAEGQVAHLPGSDLDHLAVTSCINLVGSLHGCQLVTVEDLAEPESGDLHPVQQAMVDEHGSQCGFCTPGFVMSLFAFAHGDPTTDRHDIDTALSGNLCRCTGYRPIIAAARTVAAAHPTDRFDADKAGITQRLQQLDDDTRDAVEPPSLAANGHAWVAPRTVAEATDLLADDPEATIVAGATDLALEITQSDRRFAHLLDVSRVAELHGIEVANDRLWIGAAVPLTTAARHLSTHFPATAQLWDRFGSVPVRNRATLGGNLATASPIGDATPVLLALDARVVVASAAARRSIPVAEFFLDYRETALEAGELVAAVSIPLATSDQHLSVSKVSKRHDDDISAVCAAINLTIADLDGTDADDTAADDTAADGHGDDDSDSTATPGAPGTITAARVAFGGMAATPARATGCEAALVGQVLDDATLDAARTALAADFTPIDDMRATAAYRTAVAGNLLTRAFRELAEPADDTPIRVSAVPS